MTATLPPARPRRPEKPEPVRTLLSVVHTIGPGQSLMLWDIRWAEYERLLSARERSGLGDNGTYVQVQASRYFPALSAAGVAGCLIDLTTVDDSARLRRFREWLRTPPPNGPTG